MLFWMSHVQCKALKQTCNCYLVFIQFIKITILNMIFYYIAISAILFKQLGSWRRTLPTTIIDQKLSSILHLAKNWNQVLGIAFG